MFCGSVKKLATLQRMSWISACQKPNSGAAMSYHDTANTWFLAQLRPNSAAIAERNLQRQHFLTFLPRETCTRRVRGQFVSRPEPLFPGYIFVSFNPARGRWNTINSTFGVSRLVSFGSAPAQVPDDLVSKLILRCDAEGMLRAAHDLSEGDTVVIASGPFSDFIGQIETIEAEKRVFVLLDMMGRQTRVQANAQDLRKV